MKSVALVPIVGAAILASGRAAELSEPLATTSGQFHLESTGVRVAYSATRLDQRFHQVESFASFEMPCRIDLDCGWAIRSGVDFSAGALGREGLYGFVGTAGPIMRFVHAGFPLEFIGGCSSTIISRHEFDEVNLGLPFQFTTHLGMRVDLGRRWAVSYRFQHMSNAGLNPNNPGLEMHAFGVLYRF